MTVESSVLGVRRLDCSGDGPQGPVLQRFHGAHLRLGDPGNGVERRVGHETQGHDLALVGGQPADGGGTSPSTSSLSQAPDARA